MIEDKATGELAVLEFIIFLRTHAWYGQGGAGEEEKMQATRRIADPAFDFNDWNWNFILMIFWFRIKVVTSLLTLKKCQKNKQEEEEKKVNIKNNFKIMNMSQIAS